MPVSRCQDPVFGGGSRFREHDSDGSGGGIRMLVGWA